MIINPRKYVARDLQGIAAHYANIKFGVVERSQFPNTLSDADGAFSKPSYWSLPLQQGGRAHGAP